MFLINKSFWEVKETKNRGLGVFAKKEIKRGTVIGDYLGKLIDTSLIFDPELEKDGLYLMWYTNDASIYPDRTKPGIYLFNHSCEPNCYFFIYKWHTLFYALRDIKRGEELTVSYMLSPEQLWDERGECTHSCLCGSKSCTGTMHMTSEKYAKWKKYQAGLQKATREPKVYYGKNLPRLRSYPKFIFNTPPI